VELRRDIPKTSETAARVEVVDVISSSLKTTAQNKDQSTDHDCPFSTEAITSITSEHGTKESTAREDRHNSTTALIS
jgi:hypothetical protein